MHVTMIIVSLLQVVLQLLHIYVPNVWLVHGEVPTDLVA
jgi:hypothetical protein